MASARRFIAEPQARQRPRFQISTAAARLSQVRPQAPQSNAVSLIPWLSARKGGHRVPGKVVPVARHPETGRDETESERIDRNLQEMIGELRVALPGVQVLFAFLLVVPFNQRFASGAGD